MSRSRPAAGQLLAGDGVGRPQHVEPLLGDLADDPDAEPRAGERLAPDDRLGQAELRADRAHLVLEERAQRLDERELQVVGQAADVVVALDVRGAGAAAGLDDVGIERALDEELDRSPWPGLGDDLAGRRLEDPDELAADDLALLLRVGDAGERVEEPLGASTTLSRTPVAATKSLSTCSASPARSRPWSTKTQVSWSPTARCTSAAATAESTPPDSPQITRLVADLRPGSPRPARR